ncbi:ATP-binding protein [Pseudomonas sp. GD03860]|uniref:ATP-binding protein n=1 Tax=Pseudomonas TaxID=286 RepID=UPI00236333A6|nr:MULTISPECIES: ATP-binding protein [Pseudomonas]MDD2058617.1 ATP-binding protein [Pseudomonas putida]MDH0640806.1 ATP-binding protein [Pseudomonas sp. GD03860]
MQGLLAGVMLALSLCAAGVQAQHATLFTAAEQQWMREHPVVRYAIDPYWPIEYEEFGQHRGLTREYIAQIERISGLRFRLVETASWSDTIASIQRGEIDLSSAVSVHLLADEMRKKILLSDVYFVSSTVVVTRSFEPIMFTPDKLNGKTVAVKGGGSYERYLRAQFPDIKLLLIANTEQALAAVDEGRADAAVGLDIALQPVIRRKYFDTLHLAGVLSEMPAVAAMGVAAGNTMLVSIINKSLGQLNSKDTDRMMERWIESTDYGAPSWSSIGRYYALEIGLLVAGLCALVYMARRARRAQREAQRSESEKSAFLAMMSHEIRTPMNGVISSIELLQRTPLDSHQQELVSMSSVSASSLLALLDDVLDISKLDAKSVELERLPTDMAVLAKGLADVHRLNADARHTTLTLHLEGLDDVLLVLDPLRLRQVVSNLLSNAVKFTEHGEITLTFNYQAAAPDSGWLRIRVSDTGIGISPSQQKRLFNAFVQADSSITRRYGGTGLGLSICKRLVELMGGRIQLSSEVGRGTHISCLLPVLAQGKGHVPAPVQGPSAPEPHGLCKQTILIVEDHPLNQKALSLQLHELGYVAKVVEDGPAALQALEQREGIAIVLLDCHLPGMDGYEVARRIRQQEHGHGLEHLPIIATSASTDEQHTLRCIESGIDGSLAKPLRLVELKQLLAFWLLPAESTLVPAAADDFEQSMRQIFLDASRDDLQGLRDSLARDDLALALHHSHRIHGSALTAGATEMVGVACELEQQLRTRAWPNEHVETLLNQLEEALACYGQR